MSPTIPDPPLVPTRAPRAATSDLDSAFLGEGLDLWSIAWRRKWLIILGTVTGLALGILYALRQPPTFESTAKVLVKERNSQPLPIDGADAQTEYGTALSDHSAIMVSPRVIERAIRDDKLARLPSFAESPDPVWDIAGGLKVSYDEKAWVTSVLDLTYSSTDADDCQTVLGSVIDSYTAFLGEMEQNVGQDTVQLITRAKDELLKQLTEKEDEYARFRQQAPLFWKDGQATNPHQQRQEQIEQVRATLDVTAKQLATRIEVIQSAKSRGNSPESTLLLVQQLDASSGLDLLQRDATQPNEWQADRSLLQLQLEERTLTQKYGPDYPRLKSIRRQIELARQLARNPQLSGDQPPPAQMEPAELVATYLQSLREQLRSVSEEKKAMDALFTQEEQKARSLASFQAQDTALQNEIARTKQLFEVVVQRLSEINLVEDYGGYNIQVISPPELGEQVAPNVKRIVMAAGVLGMMLGCALAYVVDLRDKTFHSDSELTERLGLPVVGHVPQLPKLAAAQLQSKLDPVLYTVHRPRSPQAESFRAIRTALYFTRRPGSLRVVQITSPLPRDGKSTLAANLATTIANSGKKVVLLDADFRRPTQHKLFCVENKVGLASVIDGTADPLQAAQDVGVENLSLLTCGPSPANPSELLTSPRFEELLEMLREQFEYVIIDTPPVLAVTDPCAVAARADGVLLALRIQKNVQPGVIKARDTLVDLGANVVGVVVNCVDERKRAYGYGGYRYGGYRYGYNGYGSGNSANGNGTGNGTYYDTDEPNRRSKHRDPAV